MDSNDLWLVVDASGSSNEGGRKMLNRQVCRCVEQYLRFGYGSARLHLVVAAGAVNEVEWNPDEEFPLEKLSCSGVFDSTSVVKFFEGKPGRVLIVTDGFLSARSLDVLSDWAGAREPDSVRMIVTNSAKNFAGRSIKAYSTQEFFLALDHWLETGTCVAGMDAGEDEW